MDDCVRSYGTNIDQLENIDDSNQYSDNLQPHVCRISFICDKISCWKTQNRISILDGNSDICNLLDLLL